MGINNVPLILMKLMGFPLRGGSRQALMITRVAEADLLRTSLECRSVATFNRTRPDPSYLQWWDFFRAYPGVNFQLLSSGIF